MNEKSPKIGVFVVAYNASTTISQVLTRIKSETWERISEVFVFDDSSIDDTADKAVESRGKFQLDKVKIFRNQVNLGYGGNQKRGYRYAIEHGFDIVVLLHGDGQYAPEVMDQLINPLADDSADAVFGSRMIVKGQATEGGMPFYKYAGNKILTATQNFVMGQKMSEYHSGYRAYNVNALADLPIMKNSNDFHFDNEIIVQLMDAGMRIKETPIPTYYGEEICYVNGIAYAFNVMKTVARYKLHRLGFLYCPQFDLHKEDKYTFKENRYSSHNQIIGAMKKISREKGLRVLDIGCGAGLLARKVTGLGHEVTGVDNRIVKDSGESFHRFYTADIEKDFGVTEPEKFDVVALADILEHTRNPEEVTLRARKFLEPEGKIVASTGNVANLYIRLALLFGRFTYTERGILDRTHSRLFTKRSFLTIFRECGFKVEQVDPTPIPFELVFRGWPRLANLLCAMNQALAVVWPSLFAYQVIVTASLDSKATELLRNEQIYDDYREHGV